MPAPREHASTILERTRPPAKVAPNGAEEADLGDACAHLTNYAINKHSDAWEDPADAGGEDADKGSRGVVRGRRGAQTGGTRRGGCANFGRG